MKRYISKIFLLVGLILIFVLPAAASTNSPGIEGIGILGIIGSSFAVGIVVNAGTLIALQKSFRALYQESYDAITPSWPKIAMEAPSTHASENYQWLGALPKMREWLGEKIFKKLTGFQYTIVNKDWESSVDVDRNKIEDDSVGIYRPAFQQLGVEGKNHPDQRLSEVRELGITEKCYDESFFYVITHKIGKSGTMSNLLAGTGVTVDKVRADFFSAKAAFRKFKDDQGKPFIKKMGNLQLQATIPADLEKVFDELNNPAPGATTPKTPIDYVIDPYLTDANDWYLDYTGGVVKPFIFQVRKQPTFVGIESPEAESVFMSRQFKFSCEARHDVGYGMWQYSIKITNT
jgi:phage major head subunit gpT-like protein